MSDETTLMRLTWSLPGKTRPSAHKVVVPSMGKADMAFLPSEDDDKKMTSELTLLNYQPLSYPTVGFKWERRSSTCLDTIKAV